MKKRQNSLGPWSVRISWLNGDGRRSSYHIPAFSTSEDAISFGQTMARRYKREYGIIIDTINAERAMDYSIA